MEFTSRILYLSVWDLKKIHVCVNKWMAFTLTFKWIKYSIWTIKDSCCNRHRKNVGILYLDIVRIVSRQRDVRFILFCFDLFSSFMGCLYWNLIFSDTVKLLWPASVAWVIRAWKLFASFLYVFLFRYSNCYLFNAKKNFLLFFAYPWFERITSISTNIFKINYVFQMHEDFFHFIFLHESYFLQKII